MNEDEQRTSDAMRMLRAAVDAEMISNQLGSEEDVIGIPTTLPRLNLTSARYYAAIELLVEVRALEQDEETDAADQLVSSAVGASEVFKISSAGIELLRQMGM